MSKIADASARAGRVPPVDDTLQWERDGHAVQEWLNGKPASQLAGARPAPAPVRPVPTPARAVAVPTAPVARPRQAGDPSETIGFELAATVRRLFLAPNRPIKSVLFCTVPGDPMADVAWQAADLLATQSSRRVAFVEDGSNSVVPRGADCGQGLITRIGWYPAPADAPDAVAPRAEAPGAQVPGARVPAAPDADLGGDVNDLLRQFDFVIVNATAPSADDLVPLAREVDGVIVLITETVTRREAARTLVQALRRARATLLGVVLTGLAPSRPPSLAHGDANI